MPAAALTLIVASSTIVRAAIGLQVPSPWILPDEVVYSELAKSIAAGTSPSVRGVPVFGWGEVYPTLIAPAWALFDDPVRAYHATLTINALVMSLAAVPAYLLARVFLSRGPSLLVAAITLLVPSMAYTGVVMTENAFYPVFLLSVFLIARAVRCPTLGNQALSLLGLLLVAFTRIQGIVLLGAYLVAVVIYALTGSPLERQAYLKRSAPTACLLLALALAPSVASVVKGEGVFGWLGARAGTFDGFRPLEVPEWFAYLTGDLILYVAVAPAVATAIVLGRGFSRQASESLRLFAAVALPTFVAMLALVSLVSSSFDVDGTENLNERYVFYVVPLVFLGLALWARAGLPRPRPWAWVALGSCCALPVLLPIERLEYNAGFQSLALLPWLMLELPPVTLGICVAAFVSFCGAVWLTCRPERVWCLWLLTGTTMVFVGLVAVSSNAGTASDAAKATEGRSASWVDDAVPVGTRVAVLWDEALEHDTSPGWPYFWLMATEVLNESLGDVYRLGGTTYYEAFLPTIPLHRRPDGTLVGPRGTRPAPRYALVTCHAPVEGNVVARAPRGAFQLVEVEPPLRLSTGPRCPASGG